MTAHGNTKEPEEGCTSNGHVEQEKVQSAPEKPPPDHPQDTGWAWVVLAASWIVSFSLIGALKSYGIYFIEFLVEFQTSTSTTALLTTTQSLCHCFSGAFSLTYGVRYFSFRLMAATGVIFITLGYTMSFFAESFNFLFFSQGLLIGLGNGLIFNPVYVLMNQYFNKRRGLANGIYLSGNSFGGFVMPYVFSYILGEYGLRGSMILTGGIILNTLWAIALLRPISFYKGKNKSNLPFSIRSTGDVDEPLLDSEIKGDLKRRVSLSQPNISINKEDLTVQLRMRTISCVDQEEYDKVTGKKASHSLDAIFENDVFRSLSMASIAGVSAVPFEVENSEPNKKEENSSKIKKAFKSLFKWEIFKNKKFIFFLLAYLTGCLSPALTHIFVAAFAGETLQSESSVATVLSIISLSDFGGRIFCGYCSDKIWANKYYFIIFQQVVMGSCLLMNNFYTEFWHFVLMCGIYGFVFGFMFSLLSSMLVDILGPENVGNGLLPIMLLQTLFISPAVPFLGYLRDVTTSYSVSLFFMGSLSILSSLLYVILNFGQNRCFKHKEQN